MPLAADYVIRDYTSSDEQSWLRCRILSFLTTAYFDDVVTTKPTVEAPGFELVAINTDDIVIGLIDVTNDDTVGTINTLAVHPDHLRRGIARTLLSHAVTRGHAQHLTALSAWTRDDPTALHWYRTMGFIETDHYLHVFANRNADPAEPDRAVDSVRPGLQLMSAFLHADLADEPLLRRQFTRIHVCRRFTRAL
ncbi:GNAT family N-acetyltransferase [Mycobacteroides chelonae]|jgi:N-acetylglutamate synthase-like GNAT family acetyltransferase|uniref:GNAT family N-acetyltransferase n=2 Tax=Mycobacteroides chelonae TaxID=1774 RepID=A0A1S1LWS9_MYCCH|nr:GNAT family N-acetyltransferase [Mycobacteroides chelonae]PKQ55782.1 GNAT family N-acetyltransferase [Mycobacterium sp. MHSD3]SKL99924.1 Acetyltransferase (GNAT) family [Mycobacteroides abscessus subsp. bolletii]MBF9523011.1 GNAT family N-acetyltransferase [Mycobacteroides chelonae]OHU58859.1 GNAT family N-acetyltransferase [Mycobacteroides chelonae]OHU75801.1 GNAT family N-acetyltransferase [Mycobacteroides chelonae]